MLRKSHASVQAAMMIAAITICAAAVGAQNTDGLVSYWSFDDIAGDRVADDVGDSDGTINGGVEVVEGKFGQALNFDGVIGTYVDCGDMGSLDFDETFTVIAWVYPFDKFDGHIISKGVTAVTSNWYWIYQLPTGLSTAMWGGSVIDNVWAPAQMPEGSVPHETWTHIAMTVDSAWA